MHAVVSPDGAIASRKFSPHSVDFVVVSGVAFFFALSTLDAIRIFQQFPWYQVLAVGFTFLLITVGLATVFNFTALRDFRAQYSRSALGRGLLLGGFLYVFSLSAFAKWAEYFPSAPLQEMDAGRGLHPDTVFHVSLIQSILNVGYPSTGQHGLPFLPYHVLSHYVDAGILAITGLEPLDAYGLLFHFKVGAFLVAALIFLWALLRESAKWWMPLSVLLFIPALAGDWLVIGSEGLWFTSLLVILSAPLLYRIMQSRNLTTSATLILALIGIAIGIGKVSSGFAFALLVGIFLIVKEPRNPRIYILGTVWAVFFALFSIAQDSGSAAGLKVPHLSGITGFLNPWTTYPGGPVEWNLLGIYLVLAVIALTWYFSKRKEALIFVISTLLSLVVLSVLMMLPAPDGLMQPDIAYFVLGLYFLVLLLGLAILRNSIKPSWADALKDLQSRILISALVLVGLVLPKIDLLDIHFQDSVTPQNGPSQQFRTELSQYMEKSGLSKRNAYLVIPKEEFETSISKWGTAYWAEGLNVYALTGVPLLYGITDSKIPNFGQNLYDGVTAISIKQIASQKLCTSHSSLIEWRGIFLLNC